MLDLRRILITLYSSLEIDFHIEIHTVRGID